MHNQSKLIRVDYGALTELQRRYPGQSYNAAIRGLLKLPPPRRPGQPPKRPAA